jgi:hypothetical protein
MNQPLRKQRSETEQCLQDLTRICRARIGLPGTMSLTAGIDLMVQNEGLIAETSDGVLTSAVAQYIAPYLDQLEKKGEMLRYDVRNAILSMENSVLDSEYGELGAEKIKNRVLDMNKVVPLKRNGSYSGSERQGSPYSNGWLDRAASTNYR